MKLFLILCASVLLYAKDIFLVNTKKCQVFFNENNSSKIYLKGYCDFKDPLKSIDKIIASSLYDKTTSQKRKKLLN